MPRENNIVSPLPAQSPNLSNRVNSAGSPLVSQASIDAFPQFTSQEIANVILGGGRDFNFTVQKAIMGLPILPGRRARKFYAYLFSEFGGGAGGMVACLANFQKAGQTVLSVPVSYVTTGGATAHGRTITPSASQWNFSVGGGLQNAVDSLILYLGSTAVNGVRVATVLLTSESPCISIAPFNTVVDADSLSVDVVASSNSTFGRLWIGCYSE